MLPDSHPPVTSPARENHRQSPAADDIDALYDRICGLAGNVMTDYRGDARTLATLVLHFARLQENGWPMPSAWIQPIPEVIDIDVTGDLL